MSTNDRQQTALDTADADRIEAGYRVENAKKEMLASAEVSDAIAAHEAAADPHPNYATAAELAALAVLVASAGGVPTLLTADYSVAANKQVLFSLPIEVGTYDLDISGDLVEVS